MTLQTSRMSPQSRKSRHQKLNSLRVRSLHRLHPHLHQMPPARVSQNANSTTLPGRDNGCRWAGKVPIIRKKLTRSLKSLRPIDREVSTQTRTIVSPASCHSSCPGPMCSLIPVTSSDADLFLTLRVSGPWWTDCAPPRGMVTTHPMTGHDSAETSGDTSVTTSRRGGSWSAR